MGSAKRHGSGVLGRKADVKVTDLIDKATLQALQDQFTDEYGIANGLLDVNANPITYERGHCTYCTAVRKETPTGLRLCRRSDQVLIDAIMKSRKPLWHICEGVLLDFGTPVLAAGRIAAYFFWGQIRCNYCQRRSNGISAALQRLGFEKGTDGRRKTVPKAVRQQYYDIESTDDENILTIAKAGHGFAKRLGGMLDSLVRWEQPREIEKFVARMVQTRDMDSLYDLCVSEIPRLLETNECSVFTVVKERADAKPRLVLRRTTHKAGKHGERRISYEEGQGLTGWVWKNRSALRINDVNDKEELVQYPGLKWSQTFDDSGTHKEWLSVPLFGLSGDVIGVIRVPEKKRDGRRPGGGFDLRDEIRLMLLGKHIAHEIELLRARDRASAALRISQDCAVKLCSADDATAVVQTIMDAAQNIFGEMGKAQFFNVINEDNGRLIVQDIRGTLTRPWMRQREVPKGSLSGACIAKREAMILHNIPAAKQSKMYFELAEGLECAMSAPVCSGSKLFGALSVGANRQYELTEEPDLHILKELASLAGAALARLEAEEIAQLSLRVRGVTHTLGNRIPTLNNWINVLRKKAGGRFSKEIDRLAEGVDFVVGAVEVAKQYGRLAAPSRTESFELTTVFERLKCLYSDNRIRWDIQGKLHMLGEKSLIEQTIIELVANALRFVPKQRGRVRIKACRRRNTLIIRVSDNGPGVAADRKTEIFRPSTTSDPATHFGFGLSFVHRVVQRHGGYIVECGTEGKGASFHMEFPLQTRSL